MKHTPLKRLLAFVLAAMMLLSLAACGNDGGSTSQTVPSITSPTLRQPGTDTTFPHVTEPEATSPSTPSTSDTVTVHAYVPADWTAPCCWAWDDSADAFDAWPGQAMTKNGDWYETQVPSWIANVIISNNGAPQTEDLSVEMGKELWVVVDAAGSTVHYSEPEIYAPADPTPPVSTDVVLEHEDLSYVMIYNPNIYDEYSKWNTNSLATGYLGSQIDVDAHRGGSLEEESPYISVSQAELNSHVNWEGIDLSGSRGDNLGINYNVGDTKDFYCSDDYTLLNRSLRTMTCVYAGKYCHVWNDGTMTTAQLQAYGKEFDNNIYETMVETFGTARFVGETGKVNLLFYPIEPKNGGITLGYFYTGDLFSSSECNAFYAALNGYNTDHAIVHINTYGGDAIASTIAHEFQHLICYTNSFSAIGQVSCRSWLNEAMSGYTEELIYPGSKALTGHYWDFNNSDSIRKGQSLYNFNTDYDIGVYGGVYYFSEYLAANAGKDVFSKIHDYWRNSYSDTLCEAEAIVNSVPASFKNAIDGFVTYSDSLEFASDDEEWMSKMTLHFYLSMLSKDGGLAAYDHILNSSLLYDELDGTTIEGGGRIILATKDTSFEIPSDADSGLIYIGLDKDFQIVTAYVPQ